MNFYSTPAVNKKLQNQLIELFENAEFGVDDQKMSEYDDYVVVIKVDEYSEMHDKILSIFKQFGFDFTGLKYRFSFNKIVNSLNWYTNFSNQTSFMFNLSKDKEVTVKIDPDMKLIDETREYTALQSTNENISSVVGVGEIRATKDDPVKNNEAVIKTYYGVAYDAKKAHCFITDGTAYFLNIKFDDKYDAVCKQLNLPCNDV